MSAKYHIYWSEINFPRFSTAFNSTYIPSAIYYSIEERVYRAWIGFSFKESRLEILYPMGVFRGDEIKVLVSVNDKVFMQIKWVDGKRGLYDVWLYDILKEPAITINKFNQMNQEDLPIFPSPFKVEDKSIEIDEDDDFVVSSIRTPVKVCGCGVMHWTCFELYEHECPHKLKEDVVESLKQLTVKPLRTRLKKFNIKYLYTLKKDQLIELIYDKEYKEQAHALQSGHDSDNAPSTTKCLNGSTSPHTEHVFIKLSSK